MLAAPRFYCPVPLSVGDTVDLPSGAARHVQVLRLQPGNAVTLFGSSTGEYDATIAKIGRQEVRVVIGQHHAIERQGARALHLAIGMPANERMDWLVEKATELGVSSIAPLMTERSVVRLDDERAKKRAAHWNRIAIAACEQCGRNQIPAIVGVATLSRWTRELTDGNPDAGRLVLSLQPEAPPLRQMLANHELDGVAVTLLCGPEGGLSAAEEALAASLGFRPVSLGAQVLRSETAALAALTLLA